MGATSVNIMMSISSSKKDNDLLTKLLRLSLCLFFIFQYYSSSSQHWNLVDPSLGQVSDIAHIDETLHTISNLGLYAYSEDGGETWIKQDLSEVATLPSAIFTTITFFDQDVGMISIRNQQLGNQLIETSDGGKTWEVAAPNYESECSEGFIPLELIPIDDSKAILSLLSSSSYQVTSDRGQNWTCENPFQGPSGLRVLKVLSDSTWISNGSAGLYRTTDAGDNWELIFDKQFAHYQITEEGTIYGLSWYYEESSRLPTFYISDDEFATYDSIPVIQFQDELVDYFVVIDNGKIYLRSSGKNISFSDDGGRSFTPIQTLSNQPERAQNINGRWYLYGRGLWELGAKYVSTQTTYSNADIYPNPTTQDIYIKSSVYQHYEVWTHDGSLIKTGKTSEEPIDISNCKEGFYLLKLYNTSSYEFQKIIKL